MYNGLTEKACGEARIIIRNPVTMKKYKITFVVIDENRRPIIGKLTAEKMGLITINYPKFVEVNQVKEKSIFQEYKDVFADEIGKLPGLTSIPVKREIETIVSPPRKVPEELKKILQEEIIKEKSGVIVPTQTNDWVSQTTILLPKPNGKWRVCIDPRPLNKALKDVPVQATNT